MREYSGAAPIPRVSVTTRFRIDRPTPAMVEALREGQHDDRDANNRLGQVERQLRGDDPVTTP